MGVRDDQRLLWSRDGRTLYYLTPKGRVSNVWRRPVAGGPPVPVTQFEEPVQDYEWSFDGRTLACSRGSETSDIVRITGFR